MVPTKTWHFALVPDSRVTVTPSFSLYSSDEKDRIFERKSTIFSPIQVDRNTSMGKSLHVVNVVFARESNSSLRDTLFLFHIVSILLLSKFETFKS